MTSRFSRRLQARIDANQPALVEYLRKMGASVAITSSVGNGFPDLVVGYRGINYLIEVKDPEKPPSARKLTPKEADFHDSWEGQCCVVQTEFDCRNLLYAGLIKPQGIKTEMIHIGNLGIPEIAKLIAQELTPDFTEKDVERLMWALSDLSWRQYLRGMVV